MQNVRGTARTTNAQPAHVVTVPQPPAQAGDLESPDASAAPLALPPVPDGGGRIVIQRQGRNTVITSASLPPQVMPLARMGQETAFGVLGLLAAIIILGPFARMFARRGDRRTEINATSENTRLLQQQLQQLQQSMDAISVEVERISESQRFQSKLLHEKRSV